MEPSSQASPIEKLEAIVNANNDKLRALQSPGLGVTMFDIQLGTAKGAYGFAKDLVTLAIEAAVVLNKLQTGAVMYDPELQEKIIRAGRTAYEIEKDGFLLQYGSLAQKEEVAAKVRAHASNVLESIKKSVTKSWDEASRDGKQAEFISKWTTRGVLEIAVLFVGIGEARAAAGVAKGAEGLAELSKAAKVTDEVIQACPRVIEAALAKGLRNSTREILEGAGVAVEYYTPAGKVLGQAAEHTCVAAACRMVASDAGLALAEAELAGALETTKGGALVVDAGAVLEKYGIKGGQALQSATLAELEAGVANGKSALVGLQIPGYGKHAVVVDRIAEGRVFIREPLPQGIGSGFSIPVSEFEFLWKGRAVIFK